MKIRILTLGLALGVSTILSGCSTTQAQFEKNPKALARAPSAEPSLNPAIPILGRTWRWNSFVAM
jgi:predicted component of type VI protein secretion system